MPGAISAMKKAAACIVTASDDERSYPAARSLLRLI
jgi:hypothetical protein